MEAQAQSAQMTVSSSPAGLRVALAGPWEMEKGLPASDAVCGALRQDPPPKRLVFETEGLGEWDSGLLVFVLQCVATAKERGIELDLNGLPDRVRRLLNLAQGEPLDEAAPERRFPNLLAWLGHRSVAVWNELRSFLDFLGECVLSLGRFVRGKARYRPKDFWLVVEDCGPKSLPIILLIAFLIGLVIAFLGAVVLQRLAAEVYVSYLVGYGMLREMGAVMTGIIIAGRTGAAFAAQLGSMKTGEEVDALRTLGLSPIDFLVLPRLVSLTLMMPLLVVFANLVGIFGGLLVAIGMFELPVELYFKGLSDAAGVNDFVIGIIKAFLFGAIVAVCGCYRGLNCGHGADAVGKAATSAVVLGITLIIAANALVDWVAATIRQ